MRGDLTVGGGREAAAKEASPRSWWESLRRRLAMGEIGQLPVVVGLILIWAIFQVASGGSFLKPENLTNLVLQIAAVGTISAGLVLVLLLGEIDLSAGQVSGFAAGVMTVLSVHHGVPALPAILAGLLTGVVVGLVQGFWVAVLQIPSFIVTLAGLLAYQGALLFVLGATGTVNMQDPVLIGLANTLLDPVWGWALGLILIGYLGGSQYLARRRRLRAGLPVVSSTALAARVVGLAVLVLGAVFVLNVQRGTTADGVPIQGVPSSAVFLVGLIVVLDYLLRRTRFGRYVFAIGGNAEAARRAGIPVTRVRIAVFVLCSTIAAWGGLLAASRLRAVHQSAGGGDVLLNAIAAAVIGGTSLFGGRGTPWAALLGALVIGSIANGMALLSLEPSVQFMITGAVLLASVTIDAIARQSRQAAGR
jgi:D-xylose transport system permease protein